MTVYTSTNKPGLYKLLLGVCSIVYVISFIPLFSNPGWGRDSFHSLAFLLLSISWLAYGLNAVKVTIDDEADSIYVKKKQAVSISNIYRITYQKKGKKRAVLYLFDVEKHNVMTIAMSKEKIDLILGHLLKINPTIIVNH